MIRGEGYNVEVHHVTTADGYTLTMHRITGRAGEANVTVGKPAVLVNHGLLCSSADWVMGSPDKSLGNYRVVRVVGDYPLLITKSEIPCPQWEAGQLQCQPTRWRNVSQCCQQKKIHDHTCHPELTNQIRPGQSHPSLFLSPGYILSDAGYDVWLGNFRGNRYSRSHLRMNPDEPPFWRFSIHELGKYDLPAMMELVLRETGMPSLSYVGHSMGTAALWDDWIAWGLECTDDVPHAEHSP